MSSLTKNKIKFLRKLKQKKYRDAEGVFIVERLKNILPFLENGHKPLELYTTVEIHYPLLKDIPVIRISPDQLQQISSLQNPYDALAVFQKPQERSFKPEGMILLLDHISDPGNLGTLLRTADWFGIRQVVCSPGSVDIYNPKTVQASMGALAKVRVFYEEPEKIISQHKLPLFLAHMQGENLFRTELPENCFVLLGNEAQGISPAYMKLPHTKISIPPRNKPAVESLNVAISGAIIMAHWAKNKY